MNDAYEIEPEPPEEEPITQDRARNPSEGQHARLAGERGGCFDWQTSLRQLEAVTWHGTYAGQLRQGHAAPACYRGDGGAVGKGHGYSCAKGRVPRYGKGQERRLFATANDWLETDQAVETAAIASLMWGYQPVPLVFETEENSADSQARVTPMRRKERSLDATFEDEGGGDDGDESDVSVVEAAAFRDGSEGRLTRDDPARLLLARKTTPARHQAELRRAWRWIAAELASYPWTFARSEPGTHTAAAVSLWDALGLYERKLTTIQTSNLMGRR